MQRIAHGAMSIARKVASFAVGLLPGPPSTTAPPPDIDGRRSADADLEPMKVSLQEKRGKGGFR